MKIRFRRLDGSELSRKPEITPWAYPSIPWTGNSEYPSGPASPDDPMQWTSGLCSKGFIRKLFREEGGVYVVMLEFDATELQRWLESYIAYEPDKALDLLMKMLPEAVSKLKEKGLRSANSS